VAAAAGVLGLLGCWRRERRCTAASRSCSDTPADAAPPPPALMLSSAACSAAASLPCIAACSAAAFADAFEDVRTLQTDAMLEGRGAAARTHVEASFGLPAFGGRLEAHLRALCV